MSEASERRHVFGNVHHNNGQGRFHCANGSGDTTGYAGVPGAICDRQDQDGMISHTALFQVLFHAVPVIASADISVGSLSTSRAIVLAACGRARLLAFADIRCRLFSSWRSETASRAASRTVFVNTPASASAMRPALRRSGPGIASKATSGKPDIAASAEVSPPGFVINNDASCISAATSSVHPSTRMLAGLET